MGMSAQQRHSWVMQDRRYRLYGQLWVACQPLPVRALERGLGRRGPLPTLLEMLRSRRNLMWSGVAFRTPRSHARPFISWWPLLRWRRP